MSSGREKLRALELSKFTSRPEMRRNSKRSKWRFDKFTQGFVEYRTKCEKTELVVSATLIYPRLSGWVNVVATRGSLVRANNKGDWENSFLVPCSILKGADRKPTYQTLAEGLE